MIGIRGCVLVVVLAGLSAVPAAAQLVTGKLVDRSTGAPLEGAFLVVVDSTGTEHGGILTNRDGRYFLRVPGAGRYTIRAERIGYATYRSEPLTLAAGETRVYDMAVSTQAIALESIKVSAGQRCTVRPGAGLRTAAVWDEARKALRLAAWTEEQHAVRYRVVNFERELDPETLRVRSETRTGRTGYTDGSPYRSLPPEDLAQHGYVRPEPDNSWKYFAPDAQVLLSDAFLDGHCFELEQRDSVPDFVGLAFRPVHRREQPDIEGVLWLDRRSGELRSLEFHYTTLPYPVVSRLIGGRIDFARVPGGPWIVSSWHIRMPEVAAQRQSVGALRPGEEHYSLVGLHEVGGEVLDVGAGRGAASTPARGGTLAGVVYDSAGFVPLANVEVALVGTARSVRTGPDGRFQLHGLPDGRYGLRATPRAWDLPWPPPEGGTALVREGDTTHIRLQLPGADDIVAAVCDEPLPDSLPGVVLGRLTDGRGRALAGDTVVVSWNRYALQNGADVRTRWQAVLAVTDGEGRYRACGLPLATPLRAAAVPPHSSATRTTNDLWLRDVVPANARQLRIDGPRVVRLDLSVRRPG